MITRLRLKNFRRYEDQVFEFGPGVTFIEGINNAGKTTIFYAIEYVLFGAVAEFKSPGGLLRPKADGGGVEMDFVAQDGHHYRLQRIHVRPPKSRTKTVGHFTLKQIGIAEPTEEGGKGESWEKYVLSSDFQDREEQLALELFELLGVNKRLFQTAIFSRQSEAALVLAGDPKLDLVLGVTAVALAADELRSLSSDFEKQASQVARIDDSLVHSRNELQLSSTRMSSVNVEQAELNAKINLLKEQEARVKEQLAARKTLNSSSSQLRSALKQLSADRLAAQHASQQLQAFLKEQANENQADETAKNSQTISDHRQTQKQMTEQLQQQRVQLRELDQVAGDLKGRIERREKLAASGRSECETCGQPIDLAKNSREIKAWQKELEANQKQQAGANTTISGLTEQISKRDVDIRTLEKRNEELQRLTKRQRELEKDRDQSQQTLGQAEPQIQSLAESVIAQLQLEGQGGGADAIDIPSARDIESLILFSEKLTEQLTASDTALAIRQTELRTDMNGLSQMVKRAEADRSDAQDRQQRTQREIARLEAERAELASRLEQSKTLGTAARAFQELQQVLRQRAAGALAARMLAIHRQLSQRDEFESLTVDPKNYAVYVRARDYSEEVPASAFQGGGQRVLLGLSFKLALAQMVGHCPFLLLDEPTDGLDMENRQQFVSRLGSLNVTQQMLVITHEATTEAGQRITIERS